jgi:hypothetical protein
MAVECRQPRSASLTVYRPQLERFTETTVSSRHLTGGMRARNVAAPAFVRDLLFFVCAVLVGTTAGIGSRQVLLHLVAPQVALNVSLALATTCTGAAHSRLVHRKPIGHLLPHIAAGAPLAYAAMRAIHFVAGF